MPEMVVENNSCCEKTQPTAVNTQRQYFNFLRNNSSDIYNIFSWGNEEVSVSNQTTQQKFNNQKIKEEISKKSPEKRVTFNEQQGRRKSTGKEKSPKKNVLHETHKRPQSAGRKSKLERNTEEEEQKREENRMKVQNYIADLKPYSRNLSNTKFQQYFNKAAPECYGRANTNQPMGGIIYGNHLKTFNMNPHTYTNHPEFYQTHDTALNYGKRTKLNEQGKWRRLQRELTKKLGLKDKNETIKQGKQVVYVDINDDNMYSVMKENHEFQKAHREEIHDLQLQYKKQKHQQYLDDINEFYAKKQDAITNQLQKRQQSDKEFDPDYDESARLNQQVIYKYHDQKGNIRYAGDRHAVTCFVDLNFPENDPIYTEELKSRMPISPKRVHNKDKNIDDIRRGNYIKSKEQVYPSHYLLRNCEQPEVLKMLSEKTGMQIGGTRVSNQTKAKVTARNPKMAKTLNTTAQSIS